MILTERDRRILSMLARARWLATSQIGRLFFADAALDQAHRRLRKLRSERYIFTVQQNRMAEALHTLGEAGRKALAGRDFGQLRLERVPPLNLEHFVGVNDVRVAVESSAARDIFELGFFFASWELQKRGWAYVVVPDAACAVARQGASAVALIEYDRGFESANYVFRTKYLRYLQGLDGFSFSHVITVVDSARRFAELRGHVRSRTPECGMFSFVLRERLRNDWSLAELFAPSGEPDQVSLDPAESAGPCRPR